MRSRMCGIGVVAGVAQPAGGFGANVVDLPGGAGAGDGGDDGLRVVVDPCSAVVRWGRAAWCPVTAAISCASWRAAAECFDGLGAPGVALLGQ